jgi:UPF0755 protein
MKKLKIIIPIVIVVLMASLIGLCLYFVSPVSKKGKKIIFEVKQFSDKYGMKDLISDLKKDDLIRNESFTYYYVRLNKFDVEAGTYVLNQNMGLRDIFNKISDSSNVKEDTITITFKEGLNMKGIINSITKNTDITEEEIINKLKDQEYLNSLIKDYWFLTEDILNPSIYYPLEGYLAPDTYEFKKDATIEDIFKKMLDQESEILDVYKASIDKSTLTIHQIITLASIAELEGNSSNNRKNIVGVFLNRLNNGMSLGSDVTTYYAIQVDMSERDLYQSEIDDINPYNTRSSAAGGMIPVGPICNPSYESIDATVNYNPNNYYFFVADKNNNVYFSKTNEEHQEMINKLIQEDLWYTY